MNQMKERNFIHENTEVGLLKPVFLSILIHAVFIIAFYYLFLFLSAYIVKPEFKVKDIEFILVGQVKPENIKVKEKIIPQKINKFGTTNVKKAIIAAPNRVNSNRSKESGKRITKKNRAASQNKITLSNKPHKGYKLAKKPQPDPFSMPMLDLKPLSDDIGFGADGTPGSTSHNSSSTPVISSGDGENGTGNSNLSGKGQRKGGGLYGGSNSGLPTGRSLQGKADNEIQRGVDFNTYISELQRRIKRNWNPPKATDNFKITLILRIAKNGNLLSVHSRNPEYADVSKSAINAVNKVFPYRQLPSDYRDNYLVISFTFDSTAASIYR